MNHDDMDRTVEERRSIRSRRPAEWARITALVTAVALAACGGGQKDDTPSDPPPPLPDGATPPPPPAPPSPAPSPTDPMALTCQTAIPDFTSKLWPTLKTRCTTCHTSGGAASTSNLIFSAADATADYTTLRNYALSARGQALLLDKVKGMASHGGGAVLTADSAEYAALGTFVQGKQPACEKGVDTPPAPAPTPGTPPPPPPAPVANFWSGVQMADDQTMLIRASQLFAGRNPTAAEASPVTTGGDAVLRATIRSYMEGPAFHSLITEGTMTKFVSNCAVSILDAERQLAPEDYPQLKLGVISAVDIGLLQDAVKREPNELAAYIVENNIPWSKAVSADYTVVNPVLARLLGASMITAFDRPSNLDEWKPARLPAGQNKTGTIDHAGVLSTHGWLDCQKSTDTNRGRHRVAMVLKNFLATDISAGAATALPADSPKLPRPVMQNPNCSVCHNIIDPMAGAFQNYVPGLNRYLPYPKPSGGGFNALAQSYWIDAYGPYPLDENGNRYFKDGDNWYRDQLPPGYQNTPMPGGYTGYASALNWFGNKVGADTRFNLGAVHFWYEVLFGRAPLAPPGNTSAADYAVQLTRFNAQNDELQAVASRTNLLVKDLLVDLFLTRSSRATGIDASAASRSSELADVGMDRVLTASQLAAKMTGVLGVSASLLEKPYVGTAATYNNFDGDVRVVRNTELTVIQFGLSEAAAVSVAASAVVTDFAKSSAQRLLLAKVDPSLLPNAPAAEPALRQNLQQLCWVLWKRKVAANDPDVDQMLKLLRDVYAARASAGSRPVQSLLTDANDPTYVKRSWAAVIAAMVGAPEFLTQ